MCNHCSATWEHSRSMWDHNARMGHHIQERCNHFESMRARCSGMWDHKGDMCHYLNGMWDHLGERRNHDQGKWGHFRRALSQLQSVNWHQAEQGAVVLGACAITGYGDGAQKTNHPIEITHGAMYDQKVSYMHINPVEEGLVTLPEHYARSSAHPDGQLCMFEE